MGCICLRNEMVQNWRTKKMKMGVDGQFYCKMVHDTGMGIEGMRWFVHSINCTYSITLGSEVGEI